MENYPNNFSFKKSLGQNFLSDENLLNAIAADAGICSLDSVLEIGPGAGALTVPLAKKAARLCAVEIDGRLIPLLKDKLTGYPNAAVFQGDIMQMNRQKILGLTGAPFKVAANLPYYITTPVIMKFLEEIPEAVSLTLMVQKEVAERLTAKAGTPEYGAVTASVALRADVSITRIVGRQLFKPVPKVDSAVIRIDRKDSGLSEEELSGAVKAIRAAFSMRRKTLVNNLCAVYSVTREQAERAVAETGYPPNIRGEALPPEAFLLLSKKLPKKI